MFVKKCSNAAIKNVIGISYFLPSRKSLRGTEYIIKNKQFIALSGSFNFVKSHRKMHAALKKNEK